MAIQQASVQQQLEQVTLKRSVSDSSLSTMAPDSDSECEELLKSAVVIKPALPCAPGEPLRIELLKAVVVVAIVTLHISGTPLLPATCTAALAAIQAVSLMEVLLERPSKAAERVSAQSEAVPSAAVTLGAAGLVLAVLFARVQRILVAGATIFQIALLACVVVALCYSFYCGVRLSAHQVSSSSQKSVLLDKLLDSTAEQTNISEPEKTDESPSKAGELQHFFESDFLGLTSDLQ